MICALTFNLKQANAPGNVLLNAKEAHLPKRSVVVVSQVFTVDKLQLGELIGRLSVHRVRQILDGIKLLTEPRDVERVPRLRIHLSRKNSEIVMAKPMTMTATRTNFRPRRRARSAPT